MLPLQAWLGAMHIPPKQQAPLVHTLPAQQGWLAPPQAAQRVPLQITPAAVHTPTGLPAVVGASLARAQHGVPALPQAAQTPLSQAVPGAVQALPAQQACPRPPQFPHAPAMHIPLT